MGFGPLSDFLWASRHSHFASFIAHKGGAPCLLSIRGKEYLECSTYHGFLVIISSPPINNRTVLVGFCSVEVRFKKGGTITGHRGICICR